MMHEEPDAIYPILGQLESHLGRHYLGFRKTTKGKRTGPQ
jgi:hypothetical protein